MKSFTLRRICPPPTFLFVSEALNIHLQQALTRAAFVTFYWQKHGLWRKRILHFFAMVGIPYNMRKFPFSHRTTSSSIHHGK